MTVDALVQELRQRIEALWAARGAARRLPSKAPHYEVEDGGVPRAMELGEIDADGWVDWQILDSPVTREQVDALEAQHGALPPALKAYPLACCQLLEVAFAGTSIMLPEVPADDPLGPLTRALAAWPPLAALGYLAFAEYGDGYGPVCLDRRQPTADGDYAVVWFDHDALHSLADSAWSDRGQLEALARPLAASCREFLVGCFGG